MEHTLKQQDRPYTSSVRVQHGKLETHIQTRGYTSSVGVQHGNTYSHKRIYKLCESPAWKHIFTQEGIQALWESNMETHRQCENPAWKHTLTQEDIQALWESTMETHIHIRWYISSVGVQHGSTYSHKRIFKRCGSPTWKHTDTVGIQHENRH